MTLHHPRGLGRGDLFCTHLTSARFDSDCPSSKLAQKSEKTFTENHPRSVMRGGGAKPNAIQRRRRRLCSGSECCTPGPARPDSAGRALSAAAQLQTPSKFQPTELGKLHSPKGTKGTSRPRGEFSEVKAISGYASVDRE
jgi:hypothetical protein